MITSMAFTVYPVKEMARARAFYEGVLGLRLSHHFQYDRYEWVEYDLGDSTFAVTTMDMGHPPGAKEAVVGFETTDLDAFVATLKERSMPFVLDVFATPVCRMAVIEDPDGNHLVIHKRHSHLQSSPKVRQGQRTI
ncbi:MAG: VOC family protein [Nitrospirota bacterium]